MSTWAVTPAAVEDLGDASGGVGEGLVEAVLIAGRPGVARVGVAGLLKVPVGPGSLAGTRRGSAGRPAVRSLVQAPGGPGPDGYRGPVMAGVGGQPDLLAGHAVLERGGPGARDRGRGEDGPGDGQSGRVVQASAGVPPLAGAPRDVVVRPAAGQVHRPGPGRRCVADVPARRRLGYPPPGAASVG